VHFAYCGNVKATLTELHRDTARIVRPVIHGGQKVVLQDRGRDCAQIQPLADRIVVSEDDLRGSSITDQAILEALAEVRE
jgi:antitoxin (DNA-binding transcriptional repressor) of toxin-antitoxin stability system